MCGDNEQIHQLDLKNRNNATQNYNSQQPGRKK